MYATRPRRLLRLFTPAPIPTGTCGRHTALHTASYRGHAGVMAALLLAGANEHLTTNSGYARACRPIRAALWVELLAGQADTAAGGGHDAARAGPRQA